MRRLIAITLFLASMSSQAAFAQDCTSPNADYGVIVYNADYAVWQGCTPKGWIGLNAMVCPEGDFCNPASVFSFADRTSVATSTEIWSDIVQITGLSQPETVSIYGDGNPEFRTCNTGNCSSEEITWGSLSQEINPDEFLQLRLDSSSIFNTLHSATVEVNGISDQWNVTTGTGIDPCAGSPSIGTMCSNGSIFAGESPDGTVPMYATITDAPLSYTWNDGSSNWVDTGIDNCSDTPAACRTGEANTAFLASLSGSGSPAPYEAAEFCADLSTESNDDWYLPSLDELAELLDNMNWGSLVGTLSGQYWSSSETGLAKGGTAFAMARQTSGVTSNVPQDGLAKVRCVRK